MLTISVKNFGPIAEGSVDLKPLTIFVGPSNTGKSYMATAVYAVMQACSYFAPTKDKVKIDAGVFHAPIQRNMLAAQTDRFEEFAEILRAIQRWASQESGKREGSEELALSSLPSMYSSWLRDETLQLLKLIQAAAVERLRQIHGNSTEVVSNGKSISDFRLSMQRDVPPLKLEFQLTNGDMPSPKFELSKIAVSADMIKFIEKIPTSSDRDWNFPIFLEVLKIPMERLVSNELPSRNYYLPAARSGVVQGQKVLAAALVRQSSRFGVERIDLPTLPDLSTEFLSHLLQMDRSLNQGQSDALSNAIAFIETMVLQGSIDLDESGGLPNPDIVYLQGDQDSPEKKFTLDQTSSMVSELAPLVLFLKYLVRSGDLLILEEPESHLHPAAQRQLARGIVRLVNAGVKVLITTHSDIIISQVNNLLALRQASEELIEQGGFEPEDFLQPDQVGAYLFGYSQELGGCRTVPLEIDPDTGIDEDEFAAVFEAIYNESITLQRDRG